MNLASITVQIHQCLDGAIEPHELPGPLHDLWRDGWTQGAQSMQPRVTAAQREADRWYYIANNPTEARAQHAAALRTFDVALNRKTTAERWAQLDRIAAERAGVNSA